MSMPWCRCRVWLARLLKQKTMLRACRGVLDGCEAAGGQFHPSGLRGPVWGLVLACLQTHGLAEEAAAGSCVLAIAQRITVPLYLADHAGDFAAEPSAAARGGGSGPSWTRLPGCGNEALGLGLALVSALLSGCRFRSRGRVRARACLWLRESWAGVDRRRRSICPLERLLLLEHDEAVAASS